MITHYPKVHTDKYNKVFVSFYINKKRFRLYNGKRVGSITNPNSFPPCERLKLGQLLAAEVYRYLTTGGVLRDYRSSNIVKGKLTNKEYIELALKNKLDGNYSTKYKDLLQYVFNELNKITHSENITSKHLKLMLDIYTSNTSKNTVRRHLNVLINEAKSLGMVDELLQGVKSYKSTANLHKPFNNTKEVLEEVKLFNTNLYKCCLFTYGCLLRPHREIRELSWGDFTTDLSVIKLSGKRNKSGKNRVVPVPTFIKTLLHRKEDNRNIFSGEEKAYNQDYFKTLWSRYKKQSKLIEKGHTLYSFRHSGAIDIFKRTGSLGKLQQAMGHSTLNVSLTYLRGLEVTELKEEDMPTI